MTLDDLIGRIRPPWMRDALCREPDHARLDWVPAAPKGQYAAQRAVCARCLVTPECLRFAIENGERGIWGGTDDHDRRRMRKAA